MPAPSHRMSKSKEYRAWIYMKGRCKHDRKYVAKGVTVCPEWECSFEQFFRDMGKAPTPDHTLDRIDGTKGYSPENCRWATYQQQNRNLSTNVRLGGELLTDIASRTGLSRTAIKYRARKGLPIDEPPIHERTHCKAGHEWTPENTYWLETKDKQGKTRMQRYCRKCRAKAQAELRRRRQERTA